MTPVRGRGEVRGPGGVTMESGANSHDEWIELYNATDVEHSLL